MNAEQNSQASLQLLVEQRTVYSQAKRYLALRLVGVFVIATGSPIVGGFWPNTAVVCGALAGLWLFLGRTYLTRQQAGLIDRAAAVQEAFDTDVFGMPTVRGRENMPSLEEIAKTYTNAETKRRARIERLHDWYPLDDPDPVTAVAICQRANVSYSDALLRTTVKIWRAVLIVWGLVAIGICLLSGVTLEEALLIIILPLLPAFLDWLEFSRAYETASHVRRMTGSEIEEAISGSAPLDPNRLLVWQERIYELRRTTPLVPDVIYWAGRKANERAMKSAASQLSAKARKSK